MAIGDFFKGIGQGYQRGLTEMGGYDPMQQVSPEEAERRRQEGMQALQRSLGRATAILSGDPRRMQLAEQQMQMAESKKKESELNKKLDDAIDNSNLPQSQKDLLKSLNTQTKAQTLMQAYEPTKEDLTAAQKNLQAYQEIAKTGTPDEIAIAKAALIGIRQGKSKEQLKNEVVASLIKQTNPNTFESYTKEEIEQQIKILDEFYGKSEEIETDENKPLTFSLQGYTIEEG
jgi:hypothetical protein